MADATDVVLTLTLAAIDTSAPALVAFNARLAEQKTLLDASSAKMAQAGAASEAMSTRQAASAEATYVRQETAAVKSYERQQIAAAKEVDAAEALYLRREAAALKSYEREQVAADASYQKQAAAAEAAAAKQSAALVKVGKGAGLLTLGVIGIAYETSKMAATFQRDMEMVRTQAGASQKEVDAMSGAILKLSSQTGTGPDQLAQALFHVESAGFRGAKALDMVRLSAEGAKVGNADLEATTNAVIGVMVSQIKGIHDSTDAMGALNAIVGLGNVRMTDLTQAIGTGVLPSFANFGLGIRDFAAAESVLTDNSFGAVEGATKLRMSVSLIGAPSGAAAKALEAVGLTASEANTQLKDIGGLTQYGIHLSQLSADLRQPDGLLFVLKDLKTHLIASGLTATEQGAVIARAFGGGRSGAAIETIYQQIDRLQGKYKAFGGDVTKFGEDWNKTTQTTAYQAAQAKANVEGLDIAVGQGLVPAVTEFLKVITPAAETLAHFTADHKTFTADALLLAGSAAGMVAVVGGVAKIVGSLKLVGLAWDAVRAKAIAAGIAEDAALLGPAALFVGLGVGSALLVKEMGDIQAAHKKTSDSMRQLYIEGKVSLDQYAKSLGELNTGRYATANSTVAAALAEAQAAKATYDHTQAIKIEHAAFTALGDKLIEGVSHWNDLTAAKKKYYQFDGKGAAALSPAADPKPPAIVDLTKEIADAQKHVNDAVNQANTDIEAYGHVLAAHQATLDRWKSTLATLQDRLSSLTDTTHLYTAANKAAANELKSLNATQLQMANEGLAKEQAAFTTMADTAISQARRMKTGVVSEYDAMLVHITKSIPVAALSIPASARVETPFLGANQFSTKGPEGSPAASAVGLAPELGTRMDALTTAIHGLPAEFQGAFDSEITKLHSEEAALYKKYISDLNKENVADAAAINKINEDYHKKIAQNLADAQAKDKAEHDRYLAAIDTAEKTHNDRLQGDLQTFNTKFATSLADYQAQVVQAQTKAASDSTQHEDRLRQLEADNNAKLAAVHGKNAAEDRANIEAGYAKSVRQEDDNYNRTVSHDESHLQGLADAFDRHVKGIQAVFDRQAKDADKQLKGDLKTAKGDDKTALKNIQDWLDGHDTKAAAAREAALAKEAGIYIRVVNGIVEAFDKGGKLIAQSMKADTSPTGLFATLQSGTQAAVDKAYAQTVIDILAHGHATKTDIESLQSATATRQQLSDAEAKATALATKGVLDFATELSLATSKLTADHDQIAGLLLHGTSNAPVVGNSAGQRQANRLYQANEGVPETQGQSAAQQLAADVVSYQAAVKANLEADVILAKATGDTATALQDTQTLYLQGNATEQQFIDTLKANDAQLLQNNAKLVDGYEKAGHFSDALNLITTQITTDLSNAVAGATIDILQHGAAIQADTDAINTAAVASEAEQYAAAQAADLLATGMMNAAKAAGHYAEYAADKKAVDDKGVTTAFDTITGAIEAGVPVTQDMIQSWQTAKKTQDDDTAAVIKASLAVGDLATAFSALSSKHTTDVTTSFNMIAGAFQQGLPVTQSMIDSWQQNKAAVDADTAATLKAYEATGQWSAAMSSISSSLTGPLNDASAKLAYDFYTHSGDIAADTKAVQDHQAALDALTQATWDASYTAANPAQQSQMLNTLSAPMISAQSAQASSEQAVANAQLGVIAANSALEVAGINAMTTQIQDMGGIIKAESAVSTARFSGQLAALNDLIPIQNDLYAITKATTPQMLQTAQEQLKIDRLTAVMDQDKAAWDIKLAQMQLQLAQDKMMVDAANAQAQMMIAMDNLAIANDALNVAVDQAKLQSDSLVIQNAIHTDLGGVQDYLSLIDGDLQQLSADQSQQMQDQSQLGYDTGYANDVAAGGAGLLAGDQLGIDQGTAAAAASNQAYQLQLAQYKVEQNQQQLQQQLVNNQQQDNASLLSEIKTLQGIIAFQNSPASRRSPIRSVGNVSIADVVNGWAATAASTQAA